MIKQFYVTGDTHGVMSRFDWLEMQNPEEVGVIILGDSGCNFYKSKNKRHEVKSSLEKYGCTFYLVRGNHEDRPENIEDIEIFFDEDVHGNVYLEKEYPYIRYLMDGGNYIFNGHSTLVVGGAYSIDKWYRLQNHWTWYPEEQLTEQEMSTILAENVGKHFDFVFTHTCPLKWEPTDLFLEGIDQSNVDKTMEMWFCQLKDAIDWDTWLFGHYHANRIERPHVEMFFRAIEDLDEVWNRWHDKDYLPPTYFRTSPNYNEEV